MDFKGNFEIVGGEKSPKRLVSRCAYGASTIDKTSKQHGGTGARLKRFVSRGAYDASTIDKTSNPRRRLQNLFHGEHTACIPLVKLQNVNCVSIS